MIPNKFITDIQGVRVGDSWSLAFPRRVIPTEFPSFKRNPLINEYFVYLFIKWLVIRQYYKLWLCGRLSPSKVVIKFSSSFAVLCRKYGFIIKFEV